MILKIFREVIKDDKTKLLVEYRGIKGLADRIVKILTDGSLKRKLSENALKYSNELSWDKAAKGF